MSIHSTISHTQYFRPCNVHLCEAEEMNWRMHFCLPFLCEHGSCFNRYCHIAPQNFAISHSWAALKGPRERFKLQIVREYQREWTLDKQTWCFVRGADDRGKLRRKKTPESDKTIQERLARSKQKFCIKLGLLLYAHSRSSLLYAHEGSTCRTQTWDEVGLTDRDEKEREREQMSNREKPPKVVTTSGWCRQTLGRKNECAWEVNKYRNEWIPNMKEMESRVNSDSINHATNRERLWCAQQARAFPAVKNTQKTRWTWW